MQRWERVERQARQRKELITEHPVGTLLKQPSFSKGFVGLINITATEVKNSAQTKELLSGGDGIRTQQYLSPSCSYLSVHLTLLEKREKSDQKKRKRGKKGMTTQRERKKPSRIMAFFCSSNQNIQDFDDRLSTV